MSSSHLTYLMEHAEDLVPVLYDHARKLAARASRGEFDGAAAARDAAKGRPQGGPGVIRYRA